MIRISYVPSNARVSLFSKGYLDADLSKYACVQPSSSDQIKIIITLWVSSYTIRVAYKRIQEVLEIFYMYFLEYHSN